MDIVYLMLLVLVGAGFFLQIEWLLLASIVMFSALVFSKAFSYYPTSEPLPQQIHTDSPPNQPVQPIVVVQSGGTAASITDNIIATMLGNVMAYDVYEKTDQAGPYAFLSRGMKMRQNMFDHHGNVGSSHQALRRDYTDKRLDDTFKKLDSILDKHSKK